MTDGRALARGEDEKLDLWSSIPFFTIHALAIVAPFFLPFSWKLVVLALVLYYARMAGTPIRSPPRPPLPARGGALPAGGGVWVGGGFFPPPCPPWAGPFGGNSPNPGRGPAPFPAADPSRNNPGPRALPQGEGWHNNHHHY